MKDSIGLSDFMARNIHAIGIISPISNNINTFGSNSILIDKSAKNAVNQNHRASPSAIIQ
jgi:S-adenosylmethionine synthetase